MIFCFSCSSNSAESSVIDVLKKYPEKKIILQDIAEIEYIPLDTSNDVLLTGTHNITYLSDKYILAAIKSFEQGDVFLFSRDGKVISRFNNKGNSGAEYINISSIAFDEKAEEIYIFDSFSGQKVYVYSKNGDYIRDFNFVDNVNFEIYNFDEQTLLAYDKYGIAYDFYKNKPYWLISKKDGEILSELDITLPVRYFNSTRIALTHPDGTTSLHATGISLNNNRSDGSNLIIGDMSSDTIYRLTSDKKLLPLITRTPSVHSSEPRVILTPELKTDKFIVLAKTTLDFEMLAREGTNPFETLIYDFTSHQTNRVVFVNSDFASHSLQFSEVSLPQNRGLYAFDALTLITAYEEDKLMGKLKELASTLTENDNPVLVYVKFK